MQRLNQAWSRRQLPGIVISAIALMVAFADAVSERIELSAATLGLLGFAAIPWIGQFIESFEGFGIKAQLRALEDRTEELAQKASEASRTAGAALNVATKLPTAETTMERSEEPGSSQHLRTLIEKYDDLRKADPGRTRTANMEEIAAEMTVLLRNSKDFDVSSGLVASGGQRLAAYAFLLAHPDPSYIEPLVDSLCSMRSNPPDWFEANPFEQYWGLLALDRMVKRISASSITVEVRNKLVALHRKLTDHPDRKYLVSRILQTIDSP